jgi:antitoxin PrlF
VRVIHTAKLTNKGQITVPKEIRDRLGLGAGHRIDIDIDRSGRLVLRPRNLDFRALAGNCEIPVEAPANIARDGRGHRLRRRRQMTVSPLEGF